MDVSTTSPTPANNSTAVNLYLTTQFNTTGGRSPLVFPGKGYLFDSPIDLRQQTGHTLLGSGGEPIWSAENAYVSLNAGPVSRLVASPNFFGEGTSAEKPLIRIPGYGNHLQRLALQGRFHLNDMNELVATYPRDGRLINDGSTHTTDQRGWIGIEIEGKQAGLGTGKLCCPSTLAIMLFRAAIKCTHLPVMYHPTTGQPLPPDNADQIILQRFFAPFCDIGLWVTNKLSLGHRISYFDQIHCDTGFRFDAGGKLWCGELVMQTNSKYGLLITGNDAAVGGNTASFQFGRVTIDFTAPGDCQVVHADATTMETPNAHTAPMIDIGFLHVDNGRVPNIHADPPETPVPLFELKNFYGDLNIYGGIYLYEGMIKVTGTREDLFPTVRIHNAKFALGHNPARIFHSSSSGFVQYEQRSCTELHDFGGAGSNEGRMYPGFEGLIDFGGSGIAIPEGGGRIYERGNIQYTGGNFVFDHWHDTVVVIGGLSAIRLPLADDLPGKEYTVTTTVSGASITLLPKSGSSDTVGGAASQTVGTSMTVKSIGNQKWVVVSSVP